MLFIKGRDNSYIIAGQVDSYDAEADPVEVETELPNFDVDWREDIKSQQGSES